MPEETRAVLGIGSDDYIQVWLKGQLVRKILNYGGPSGFACRLIEPK